MTGLEYYKLILDTLTAIGTVGAVILSLWFSLHQRKRFRIKEIKVDRMLYSGGDGTIKSDDNKMLILFENLQGFPMEIHEIDLRFVQDASKLSGLGFKCKDEVVAPLSHYELKLPLEHAWAVNSLRNSAKIFVEVKTSFGNKTLEFPDFWKKQLYDSLEVIPKAEAV